MKLRCGDVVRNKHNGEEWLVAYADYESGYLSPFGWPEGECKISDCELVEAVSDEEHQKQVALWLDTPHRGDDGRQDRRVGMVRRLYRPAEEARLVREAIARDCLALADRIDRGPYDGETHTSLTNMMRTFAVEYRP